MTSLKRLLYSHCFASLLLIAWFAEAGVSARACPFCAQMGKSLSDDVEEARVVLFGLLTDARVFPDADLGQPNGETTINIEKVIKADPILAGRRKIKLPRYIAAADDDRADYIIFGDVIEGEIDPYRGIPVEERAFVNYLVGAVDRRAKDPKQRLGYFFQFLDHDDPTIGTDAYKEFSVAPFKEVAAAGPSFDRRRLIGWLTNGSLPAYQMGLCGCLLGVCGHAEDAKILRELIDDESKRPPTGVDGLMGGYCLLAPKEGIAHVQTILGDTSSDFNQRYAALRALRFVLDEMPQVDRARLLAGMKPALELTDQTDLVIDELRKREAWDLTATIVALHDDPRMSDRIIRRAIIAFALESPRPEAKELISSLEQSNPDWIVDAKRILEFQRLRDKGT
ncbi:hypothetical protein Pan216_00270 [Planctomycetes bacterium Pan216]|uniref:HEAT repeat protein n=1 Tax=Kolteria novifilia TaxID=2527975 RepID=A0A518AWZ3_9BACT|nr:hypothetical protein Pan216_00270 [Planctomycetes bacterium Pan216]